MGLGGQRWEPGCWDWDSGRGKTAVNDVDLLLVLPPRYALVIYALLCNHTHPFPIQFVRMNPVPLTNRPWHHQQCGTNI